MRPKTTALPLSPNVESQDNGRAAYVTSYIDAAVAASERTMKVAATLVLLSAVLFVAALNSAQNRWTRERLLAAASPDNAYVQARIGPPPADSGAALDLYKVRYTAFYNQLLAADMQNTYRQSLPFPGTPGVDINDLPVVAGVALAGILLILLYALRAEFEAVSAAFAPEYDLATFRNVFTLIALRQVALPRIHRGHAPPRYLLLIAKCVLLLPLSLEALMVLRDYVTMPIGSLSSPHVLLNTLLETIALCAVISLSVLIVKKLTLLDRVWSLARTRLGAA